MGKKLLSVAVSVAMVTAIWLAAAPEAEATEGCLLVDVFTYGPMSSCTFTATSTGGWVGAAGFWSVTVTHPGGAVDSYSGNGPAVGIEGTIQPGDVVSADLSNGTLAVGSPD